MAIDLDAVPLDEARDLLAAALQAQAQCVGLWQEWNQLRWWQSGLPAMAANLVLDCGLQPNRSQLRALAQLLARAPSPAGWLIWPDQLPNLQQSVLRGCGFRLCERLWLGEMDSSQLAGLPERWPAVSTSCRLLSSVEGEPLARLYGACHQVPPSLAQVAARAFLGDPDQFSTYGHFSADGPAKALEPVAAITTCRRASLGSLLWLGTHPACRGRGYARQVTLAACHGLIQQGVGRVHVQASEAAVPLYGSLGFSHGGWLELWGCDS